VFVARSFTLIVVFVPSDFGFVPMLGTDRFARLWTVPPPFFLKSFIAQKIKRDTQGYKIVPLTNLP
jgi:hypothetical protein